MTYLATQGKAQNDAAVHFEAAGQYHKALRAYDAALQSYLMVFGDDHPYTVAVRVNRADTLRQLGDFDAARTELERILARMQSVLFDSVSDRMQEHARILHTLGSVFLDSEVNDLAVDLLSQALRIGRKVFSESNTHLGSILRDLSLAQLGSGQCDRALANAHEAVRIKALAWGEGHRLVERSRHALGMAHLATGNAETAVKELERACAARRHEATYLDSIAVREQLGAAYAACGQYQRALNELIEAADRWDSILSDTLPGVPEQFRLLVLRRAATGLDRLVSLVVHHLSAIPDAIRRLADVVLRRKAVSLEVGCLQRSLVLSGRYPHLATQWSRLRELREQIAAARLARKGDDEKSTDTLCDLEADAAKLEANLCESVPELNLERRLRGANSLAVSAALPQGTCLVEFIRYRRFRCDAVSAKYESAWDQPHYAAVVLNPMKEGAGQGLGVRIARWFQRVQSEPDLAVVELGDAESIDRGIALFRQKIAEAGATQPNRDLAATATTAAMSTEPVGKAGRQLADRLLVRLQPHLSTRAVVMAPDGDLARLPFEALPCTSNRPFGDDCHVTYVTCGRDVLRWSVLPRTASDPIVIADPDFDLPATVPASASVLGSSSLSLDRLPGTRLEGEEIAALLGVRPWLDGEALKGRLKARSDSPRILHIATHGFFLDRPSSSLHPLAHAGLALAGANAGLRGAMVSAEAGNGLLTAEDVAGLDLHGTQLVVLSACETGLGWIRSGEGVFGLRRAFSLAGACAQVVSLWKVPDLQTQELMAMFYRLMLGGGTAADAFREARNHLRRRWPHPFYWGAFVFEGNPLVVAKT